MYIYIYIYTHTHTHIYSLKHIHIRTFKHAYNSLAHTHTHTHTHIYIYIQHIYVHAHTLTHRNQHPYIYTLIQKPTYVCVCIYIYIYIYIYICVYIRGVFNTFPDFFFVRAFKIVVQSWKFSILLLYILWYDRPIFMISASNEQLQQQLEYTLLKPDSYSCWISKMQSDTLEERYAIKFYFELGKNDATETYGMLQTAFGPSCMNWASVFDWQKRF